MLQFRRPDDMVRRVTVEVPHGLMIGKRWVREFDIRPLNGYDEEYIQDTSGLFIPLRTMGLLERVLSFEKFKQPELRKVISNLIVGDRVALIFHLRRISLGNITAFSAICPECEESICFEFSIDSLLAEVVLEPQPEYLVQFDEFTLKIRPITGADIVRALTKADKEPLSRNRSDITEEIVKSCILSAEPPLSEKLPSELLELIVSKLGELEPLANMWLELNCPFCKHTFKSSFNIEKYFLEEIEMLQSLFEIEVHCIASTYQWSKDEILSLPMSKRKHYCNLINQTRGE